MNVYQTAHHPKVLVKRMEEKILSGAPFKVVNLTSSRFHLIALKSYGGMNMVEKPHFRIQGKFDQNEHGTHVNYKVRGNATFNIIAVVFAIQIIPVVAIPLLSKDPEMTPYILLAIFVVFGAIIFFLTQTSKSLRKKGEKQFLQFLDSIDKATH